MTLLKPASNQACLRLSLPRPCIFRPVLFSNVSKGVAILRALRKLFSKSYSGIPKCFAKSPGHNIGADRLAGR